jgi:hypothetical protein
LMEATPRPPAHQKATRKASPKRTTITYPALVSNSAPCIFLSDQEGRQKSQNKTPLPSGEKGTQPQKRDDDSLISQCPTPR